MANEAGTVHADLVTVFGSSRVVNLHVIESRLYYVYARSVCVEGTVIISFDTEITTSCTCGPTIALLTSSQKLIVLHPDTLLYPDVKIMSVVQLGLSPYDLMHHRLSATSSGTYIAVSIAEHSILIYKIMNNAPIFCRTVLVAVPGTFQLTGTTSPHLWYLSGTERLASVDLYQAGEHSPVSFPDVPCARCPLVLNEHAWDLFGVFMHGVQTATTEGVLCFFNETIYHICLNGAFLGSLFSGAVKFPYKWFPAIHTAYSSSGSRTYLCRKDDSRVLRLQMDSRDRLSIPTFNHDVGKIPFHLRSAKYFKFGVVPSSGTGNQIVGLTEADNEKKAETLVCEPYSSGTIVDFSVDNRKSSKKLLQLCEMSLDLRALITPIEIISSKLGYHDVQDVFYIEPLKMLLLASSHNNKVRILTGALSSPNDGSGLSTCFDFKDLSAAGLVSNHTLALVSSNGIRLHSALAPYKEIGWVNRTDDSVIMDACFSDRGVVARTIDGVSLLPVEPGAAPSNLVDGITTSFVHCSGDNIYVGLDVSFVENRKRLLKMAQDAGISDSFATVRDYQQQNGAVAVFNLKDECLKLAALTLAAYVPTGFHSSSRHQIDLIFFGLDGIVGRIDHLKGGSLCYVTLSTKYKWIGLQADTVIVLGKAGLISVSASRFQPLIDINRPSRSEQISSATVLDREIIAIVSKQELKFLAAPAIKKTRAPTLMNSLQLPSLPNNMKLKMTFVPSQRMVILHGENICMFYDSSTFEQILVTGITAVWCENIALWKFDSSGTTHEHLVFVDDKGHIETYSFQRDGQTLECTCKFRAAIFKTNANQSSKIVVHCTSKAVYVAKGKCIVGVIPGSDMIKPAKPLHSEVNCISHSKNHLIVSTSKRLFIMAADTLEELTSISMKNVIRRQNIPSDSEDDGVDDLSHQEAAKEFASHVTCTLGQKGEEVVYILCGMKAPIEYCMQLFILEFDPSNITIKIRMIAPTESVLYAEDFAVLLKADPDWSTDISHPKLRAYISTRDNRVRSIEIAPYNFQNMGELSRDSVF